MPEEDKMSAVWTPRPSVNKKTVFQVTMIISLSTTPSLESNEPEEEERNAVLSP